jgi:hypothetical protein
MPWDSTRRKVPSQSFDILARPKFDSVIFVLFSRELLVSSLETFAVAMIITKFDRMVSM